MPTETGPFDFDASYDDEFDAPIEPVEVAAPQAAEAVAVVKDEPKPAAVGKEAPRHNATTLHFAKEFGISDEEIAEATPAELDKAVRLAHKAMLKNSKQFSRNEEKP